MTLFELRTLKSENTAFLKKLKASVFQLMGGAEEGGKEVLFQ